MTAETFYTKILMAIRGDLTPRKVMNAGRKYGLSDTRSALCHWLGGLLRLEDYGEFATDE